MDISLCYIHEPRISIQVFLSEWIFRHGYYRMDNARILQTGIRNRILECLDLPRLALNLTNVDLT